MLLIRCPYSGEERPEIEFAYAGEAHVLRPKGAETISAEEWAAYLFLRKNPRGLSFERWRHVHGSGRYFNAVRDTVTDRILCTYPAGALPPEPEELERLRG